MIIDPDFLDHWRTGMVADLLDDPMAPVYIIRLWGHCQERRSDSFVIPTRGLKAQCKFPGDADAFESALIEAGFIERDGDAIRVIGWAEKNASLLAAWSNGGKGGRPKGTGSKPTGNPAETQGEPGENQDGTRAEPIRVEKSRERQTPPPPSGEGGAFANFWQAWPEHRRKVAEAQCERRWRRMGLDHVAGRVMAGLRAHVASADWAKDGGEFVPAPLLWLKERRWTAQLEPAAEIKAAARVDETVAYLAREEAHGKAIDSPETRALAAAALASLGVRRVASG